MAPRRPRLRATGATKARLVVIALAVAAVGAAIADRSEPRSPSSAAPVRLDFVYSPDTEGLLVPLIRRFNDSGVAVRGRSVEIRGSAITSGESERLIAARKLRPAVWAPASSLWGRLLNAEVRKTWVPLDNPSIVQSPQVIAMPEQTARKLGWPRRQIGWSDIPRLAASGTLRFGHPSPTTSTSGMSAVAAEYYAVTGKLAGLTIGDVNRARPEVRKLEASVVQYAPTADDFLEQLARYGPAFASAVVVQETSLVQFNENHQRRLVAVYPADGTFLADYPFIVLDGDWVSADERAAARAFWNWLRGEVTPESAARSGYRVATPGEPILPPVDPEHGADPGEPDVLLRPPAPDVLAAILAAWKVDRKPANIVLAVDISDSMRTNGKLAEVRRALAAFVDQLPRRDRVALIAFNGGVSTVAPLAQLSSGERALRDAFGGLTPKGRTALYEATAAGLREAGRSRDPRRATAVVVLTDGADDASSLRLGALVVRARRSRARVFTVAYGGAADRKALEAIATAARGKAYTAARGELGGIYRDIALFF